MALTLEETLRTLDRSGTLVKDRGYRQVWRFTHLGKPYYLKFYPRLGSRLALKRLVRGNPAMREFTRLQWLQKASVSAPRAVAVLVGFNLSGRRGDAVILEAIEPAVPLDHYLNDRLLRGETTPHHREIARQIVDIVHALGKAKLGHGDLHLGNFLLSGAEGERLRLHLLDAYAVHRGGLRLRDLMLLGHSVRRYAGRSDLLRAWRRLEPGAPLPRKNTVTPPQWRKFLHRITRENRYFGMLSAAEAGGWSGIFFKQTPLARRWSAASGMQFARQDWSAAWSELLGRMRADQLDIIKRSRSGDVLSAEVSLGGRPLSVIVKRPRRKYWYRYLTDIGRGARPRRAWRKAWKLIVRDVPTAWPLLMMEKRVFGYVTDSVIVYERVRGQLLSGLELDEMPERSRDALFHRIGRTLRALEETGLAQVDAKASNWMIVADEKLGPLPVAIDVDGIRRYFGQPLAIHRILRSMKDHPQYTPADSLALCQGYAPFARIQREPDEPEADELDDGIEAGEAGR